MKRNAHHINLTWQAHKVEIDWGLFLGAIRAEIPPLGRLSVFSLLQLQVNSPSGPSPALLSNKASNNTRGESGVLWHRVVRSSRSGVDIQVLMFVFVFIVFVDGP